MLPDTDHARAVDVPAGVRLATIWRRAVALLIDELLVAIPLFVVFALVSGDSPSDVADGDLAKWFTLTSTVIVLVYYAVAVWWRGRTVGKWIMGMKVVRVTDGGPVGFSGASLRSLVPAVAGAPPVIGPFLAIAVYAVAMFDRRRQGLHDKAAGTVVVDTRPVKDEESPLRR